MDFISALQILFIALKLIGIIHWSWWIVLLPLIIPCGVFAIWLLWMLLILLITSVVARL